MQRQYTSIFKLIANNLYNMNRYEEALEQYDLAIQKNSEDADYYKCKG
ncbi:unnamed protein product [Paramecium pentaurelia]|uniref:Uncharacterized protein n=1 Tax=Paramecium pentaurelia TaxID=43138 RepID=A0A8S1YDJ9_9CILI|nr:unnamed protein product [Paramecium pentaurelia]CAD8211691.1 unnamed protein product [Paramecium pentaurelia]CAD8211695.1 unnamed protein product [Paramecium pentaurelia]CAD8211699.1 unnamed protein product [Paramecium pentaurelia]